MTRANRKKVTKKKVSRPSARGAEEKLFEEARSTVMNISRVARDAEQQMLRSAPKAAKIFDAIRRRGEWLDRCAAIRGVLPARPTEPSDAESLAVSMAHLHLDDIEVALQASSDIYVAIGLAGDFGSQRASADATRAKTDGSRGGRPPGIAKQVVAAALNASMARSATSSAWRRDWFDRRDPEPWPLPAGVTHVEPTDHGLEISLANRPRQKVSWDRVQALVGELGRAPKPGVTRSRR